MDKSRVTGAVIYTDGSARPNPGYNGWGAHGYLYTYSNKPIGNGNLKEYPTTEGYVSKKDKSGDVQYVEVLGYLDWFGSYTEPRTNNAAELSAFIDTVNKLLEDYTLQELTVLTDSEYLKKGIENWMDVWIRHDWIRQDGQPVSNKGLWLEVKAILEEIDERGINYKLIKVPAHSNVYGNERADTLALLGTLYSRKGESRKEFTIKPPKGYFKPVIDKHPFLNFKRMYYNTLRDYNKLGHYFIADHVKDNRDSKKKYIGKKAANASYAVIEITNPDPVIERVREKTYELFGTINEVMYLRLDRLYNKEIYPMVMEHADAVLTRTESGEATNISFMDRTPLATMVIPSSLIYKAINYSNILEDILHWYKNGQRDKSFTFHDVTGYLYRTDSHKLHSDITTQTDLLHIEIDIQGKKIRPPVVVGYDLPDRNTLKKIEGKETRVYLVSYQVSESHIRYHCLIETKDAVGVWANFFADSIFIE